MPDKSLAAQISRVTESIVEKKVERAVEAHRNSLAPVAKRDLPPKLKSLQSELNLLRNQLAPDRQRRDHMASGAAAGN